MVKINTKKKLEESYRPTFRHLLKMGWICCCCWFFAKINITNSKNIVYLYSHMRSREINVWYMYLYRFCFGDREIISKNCDIEWNANTLCFSFIFMLFVSNLQNIKSVFRRSSSLHLFTFILQNENKNV